MVGKFHLGKCSRRRNVEDLVVVVHGRSNKIRLCSYSSFGNDTSFGTSRLPSPEMVLFSSGVESRIYTVCWRQKTYSRLKRVQLLVIQTLTSKSTPSLEALALSEINTMSSNHGSSTSELFPSPTSPNAFAIFSIPQSPRDSHATYAAFAAAAAGRLPSAPQPLQGSQGGLKRLFRRKWF